MSLALAAGIVVRKGHGGGAAKKYLSIFSLAGAKNAPGEKRLSIESSLTKKLLELECRQSDIRTRYPAADHTILMQASVPRGRPFEDVVFMLSRAASGTPYTVSDCIVDEKKQSAIITFCSHSKKSPVVTLSVTASERYNSGTARMAIVVENMEDTSYQIAVSLLSYAEPLSVSIMPGSKKSEIIAQLADQHQKEVIIRLPLESQGRVPAEVAPTAIMVHYSKDEINAIMSDAVRELPNFTGFANAWGSRACEDSRAMNIVLANARKQHGYFLETRTTKNSVVAQVASALDCPFSQVNARIEKKTAPDILADLKRFGVQAQSGGSCVASVGASRQLCDALISARPWFRQNGIRLVFVSEIVKHPRD